MFICSVSSDSGVKPGSTSSTATKLRISRPGADREHHGERHLDDDERSPRCRAGSTPPMAPRPALVQGRPTGGSPCAASDDDETDHQRRTTTAAVSVNAITPPSTVTACSRGRSAGASAHERRDTPSRDEQRRHAATARPSTRLSTSVCWTSRRRPAPSAARTAASPASRDTTREQQVGDVDARHRQEHEADADERRRAASARPLPTVCSSSDTTVVPQPRWWPARPARAAAPAPRVRRARRRRSPRPQATDHAEQVYVSDIAAGGVDQAGPRTPAAATCPRPDARLTPEGPSIVRYGKTKSGGITPITRARRRRAGVSSAMT